RPHPEPEALELVEELAVRLEGEGTETGSDSFGRDGAAIATSLRGWAQGDERVLYLGKLLVSKGPDLLAAAWPLIHRERLRDGAASPRLLFTGFGGFERGLRELVDALGRGDLDAAREVAARGRGYEGQDQRRPQTPPPNQPLTILSSFLTDPPVGYAEAAHEA